MKKPLILLILTALSLIAAADDVVFKASAPPTVVLNQPFQLSYSVNARSSNLRAPDMEDFEILSGPFTSSSSSMSIVNGKRTSSFEQTYTYTLMAKKEGTFTIPSASIEVNKEKYTSNGLKIRVLPPDEPSAAAGSQQQGSQQQSARQGQASQPTGSAVSDENLFVRTVVSKTRVHEQECLLITYRLYTLVDVSQFTGSKIPDFSGFMKQEIEQSRNTQLTLEHYNGRNYRSAVLYQALLYPQRSGIIKIEPATFDAIVQVQQRSRARSIFDSFFDSYVNVNKTLTAPGTTIHVEPLPAGKPASFSGAVGQLSLSSTISTQEVKANEAVTLRLTFKGTGNLKMVKTPDIKFPANFEQFDPKVDTQLKTTASGQSGTKTIEYLLIPRSEGNYTIPAVEFSYFDTQAGTYKTLSTQPYELHVLRSEGESTSTATNYAGTTKQDIKQLGSDIHYIHTGPVRFTSVQPTLFGSMLHWLLYLLPALLAAVLFIVFRRQIRENADAARVKTKKANKVARKRLKQAQAFMDEGRKAEFYDEVMKAAWTYVSDKLSIPTSGLTKDNVSEALLRRGAGEAEAQELIDVLNTCEYARYAPAEGGEAMSDLYRKTADLIGKLENQIK